MALLLERPNPNQPHRPLWIGHTGRRIGGGAIQGFDDEKRVGMSVHRWQDKTDVHAELLPHTIDEHPKLYVSLGTHSLYLQPGSHSVKAYPPEAYPYWCGQFDSPAALEQYLQSLPPPPAKSNPNPLIGLAKALGAMSLAGGLLGLAFHGFVAGLIWGGVEGNFGYGLDVSGTVSGTVPAPREMPQPDVTPAPGALGKVMHPNNLTLTDPGATSVKWANDKDEEIEIAGRHYHWIVNRAAQIWWPSDDGKSGYRGRWGPHVVNDPVRRRAGMRFPEFWRMFFVALAKTAPQEFQ
jgi:hypothetical protein